MRCRNFTREIADIARARDNDRDIYLKLTAYAVPAAKSRIYARPATPTFLFFFGGSQGHVESHRAPKRRNTHMSGNGEKSSGEPAINENLSRP